MAPIFSLTVAASLLIVGSIMLPPLTSARALRRHARQTTTTPQQPITVDTRLFTGLTLLKSSTQLLIGRNQKEVEAICEVFEAMKNLEESLNEAADFNVSINETATEIEDITCNKLQRISVCHWNYLAPDCSNDKFELVCSRAPISSKANDAALAIRSTLGTLTSDQKPQWIDEHIEDEGVKYFICEKLLFGRC